MDHVLLLDMAIHGFDAMRCMTGLSASAVYCQEWNPANSWYRQGSSAAAIFELENGAVFVYRGSWCAAGVRHVVGMRVALRRREGRADLGRRRSDPDRGRRRRRARRAVRRRRAGRGCRRSRRKTASAATSASSPTSSPPSRSASEPETVGHDNIRSLAMVIGAIDSAESRPARRHRHLNGTPMRNLLDIRIGTMIRANAPDPAADVRADRRTRLREHRAVSSGRR